MQILAHQGPNWRRHALDVHPATKQTAIGVGRTIIIYNSEGVFDTELRATGRGAVSSVHFCRALGLTHLLLAATSERSIRIFDTHARRIVRTIAHEFGKPLTKGYRIVCARFVPDAPHLVLLFFEHASLKQPVVGIVANVSENANANCSGNGILVAQFELDDIEMIKTVVDVMGTEDRHDSGGGTCVLVGGSKMVYALCILNGEVTKVIVHEGNDIHDFSVTRCDQALRLAVLQGGRDGRPTIYSVSNANKKWKHELLPISSASASIAMTSHQSPTQATKVISVKKEEFESQSILITDNTKTNISNNIISNSNINVTHNVSNNNRSGKTSNNKLKQDNNNLAISCEWISETDIVTSDPRGTLLAWHVPKNTTELQLTCIRQQAHTRQIFSICSARINSCVTISMDRTAAMWHLTNMHIDTPTLSLCWRTLRSNGGVSAVTSSRSTEKETDRIHVAFASGAGAVVRASMTSLETIVLDEISETSVTGSALGKRSRRCIDALGTLIKSDDCRAVEGDDVIYCVNDGVVGVITDVREEGEKEQENGYVPSKEGDSGENGVNVVCKWPKLHGGKDNGKMKGGRSSWLHGDQLVLYNRGGNNNGRCNFSVLTVAKSENNCTYKLVSSGTKKENEIVDVNDSDNAVKNQLSSSKVMVTCIFKRAGCSSSSILAGDSDGKVYLREIDESGTYKLREVKIFTHKRLRKIECMSFDSWTNLIALSDSDGTLVVQSLDGRGTEIEMGAARQAMKFYWGGNSNEDGDTKDVKTSLLVSVLKNDQVLVWLCSIGENSLNVVENVELKEHWGSVNDLAWFSPSSSCLISGGHDGSVRVWDVNRLPKIKQ